MEEVHENQIDGHPRQIEERRRAHAGHEAANGIEIADRLHAVAAAPAPQRQDLHGLEHPRSQRFVDPDANADHDPGADELKRSVDNVQHHHQD